MLLEQAKFHGSVLKIDDFTYSLGWLKRFKARHNIKVKKNGDSQFNEIQASISTDRYLEASSVEDEALDHEKAVISLEQVTSYLESTPVWDFKLYDCLEYVKKKLQDVQPSNTVQVWNNNSSQ